MGEEYGETRPFPFFCSFSDPALIEAVRRGRREEFAALAFKWGKGDPRSASAETFVSAKLDWPWPADDRSRPGGDCMPICWPPGGNGPPCATGDTRGECRDQSDSVAELRRGPGNRRLESLLVLILERGRQRGTDGDAPT